VGVYSTGGEQYRIQGLAPGIFGNYRIVALGDGVLTISPAPVRRVTPPSTSGLEEPNRSLLGALERDQRPILSPVPGSRCPGSGFEAVATGPFADPAPWTADACAGAPTVDMR
jgi:hypothetical protein